jgi:hypothetical protein
MKLLWLGIVGMGLVACGGGSHGRDDDAGITFDATPPPDGAFDAGTDSGTLPGDGEVGSACTAGGDCEGGFCIGPDMGFPDGYCTSDCSGGGSCPDGSTCVTVDRMGTAVCLDDCDPSAAGRECRMGYGCADSFMIPPVCLPGCTDDTDCEMGLECDPTGGIGAGICFDPSAMPGGPCVDESMCPAGSFCLGEGFTGWPGGACGGPECDPVSGEGCPEGAACLETMGGGICVAGCTVDSDCRDAYRCTTDADTGRQYCGPGCTDDSQCSSGRVCNPALGTCANPFDPDRLGQACNRRTCPGGTCLREVDTGFPAAYCTYLGCDPAAGTGCPGDGVCVAAADGTTGICLDGCTGDTDCREAYACRPSDPANPMSATACLPACTSDTQCANDGYVCNNGTGLCTEPFMTALLGEPCSIADDCPGGRCLAEETSGYPSGMCVYPGCRLSGMGESEMCPTGSGCVDDGRGDPEIGICTPTCTVGTAGDCRPGYACDAAMGATEGTCGPECTGAMDCISGMCNTMTGLCE